MCFRRLLVGFLLYGSLASLLYTSTGPRSIRLILRVTHSSLLSDFLFLFLFPQEFHHWFASCFLLFGASFSSIGVLCATLSSLAHQIVVHFISCFAFFPLFFLLSFFRFPPFGNEMKLPANDKSTLHTAKHSFKNLYYCPRRFHERMFSLESKSFFSRGPFRGNLFYSVSLSLLHLLLSQQQ